jgi:ribosomal-protein-alanine N-acetyltransferase
MPGAIVASGDRLTLRTYEEADVTFAQRGCTNPALRYPLGNQVRSQTALREDFDADGADSFVVCLDGEDAGPGHPDEGDVERLGVIGIHDADYKRPELGYWLAPEYHGEGYGREAVSLAIDYVFSTYDTPAVEAEAFDFNEASIGLLESLGFTREGRRRE